MLQHDTTNTDLVIEFSEGYCAYYWIVPTGTVIQLDEPSTTVYELTEDEALASVDETLKHMGYVVSTSTAWNELAALNNHAPYEAYGD